MTNFDMSMRQHLLKEISNVFSDGFNDQPPPVPPSSSVLDLSASASSSGLNSSSVPASSSQVQHIMTRFRVPGENEPLIYNMSPIMKRNSVEEVEEILPDDPFADIKMEELTIEPVIVFDGEEIKSEPPDFDNGYDYQSDDEPPPLEEIENEADEEPPATKMEETTHSNPAQPSRKTTVKRRGRNNKWYRKTKKSSMKNKEPTICRRSTRNKESDADNVFLAEFKNATYEEVDQIPGVTTAQTEISLICPTCKVAFTTENRLRLHQTKEHGLLTNYRYECKTCGVLYERESSLAAHRRRKHGPNAKAERDRTELTCKLCSSILIGQERLVYHMQRVHKIVAEHFKYKCSKCKFRYQSAASLQMHIDRVHHKIGLKRGRFNCTLCPKIFSYKPSLYTHVRRTHTIKHGTREEELKELKKLSKNGNDQIRCPQCSMIFQGSDRLRLHMRRKHDAYKETFEYRCDHCGLTYDKKASLHRHLERKHNKELYCKKCNKQFSTRERFNRHSHDNDPQKKGEVLECDVCSLIYIRKTSLMKHLQTVHGINTDPQLNLTYSKVCEQCGKSFRTQRDLNEHVKTSHGTESYACNICEKTFKRKHSLGNHLTRFHKDHAVISSFICTHGDCYESFPTEMGLSKHMTDSHGEFALKPIKTETDDVKTETKDIESETKEETSSIQVEPPKRNIPKLNCTMCSASFSTWWRLRYHIQKKHMDQEIDKTECICQHCGVICTQTELPKHMKAEHKALISIYKCGQCKFKTWKKDLLLKHVTAHSYDKNLKCTYEGCTYKTYNKYHMAKHIGIHSGKTKQKCSLCPYENHDTNLMRNHKMEHETGQKRYQCKKCEYATNIPAAFVHHKNKHSDEKNFSCDMCTCAFKYNTSLWFHRRQKHGIKAPLEKKVDITKKRPNVETQTEAENSTTIKNLQINVDTVKEETPCNPEST